jgi:FeS assembly SUF system protein
MTDSPAPSPVEQIQAQALEASVIEVIRTCYDPEVPVNVYDLGLIYGVEVEAGGKVHVKMTLTSPACPVAGTLPPEVERKIKAIDGVKEAKVEVVWDPPWSIERMSEAARLELNI